MGRIRSAFYGKIDRAAGFVTVLFVAIFLLALAGRLVFVFAVPYSGGDWLLYGDVARNILRGCGIAFTDPATGACRPHFGGNQLPLFPIFVAGVHFVFGPSDVAVRVAQSVVASLSCAWLAVAVLRLTGTRLIAVLVGGVVSLSPVQDYWAATLLTETLAIASTQWVLAELLLSYAARRLRTPTVVLAMLAAVWSRMDGIVLLVPVAIAALVICGRSIGLRKLAIIVLVVGGSCGLWSVRNIAVGVPALPILWMLPDGTPGPEGYPAWQKTWMVTPNQRTTSGMFGGTDFGRIKIDPAAYRDAHEQAAVEALLARLKQVSGQRFPKDIDDAFAQLAADRAADLTVSKIVRQDMERGWGLTVRWIWPWSGTPYDGRPNISPTDLYRFALTIGLVFAMLRTILVGPPALRFVVSLAVSYIIARVGFFAVTANLEVRYMVEMAPFIETAAIGSVGLLLVRLSGGRFAQGSAVLSNAQGRAGT